MVCKHENRKYFSFVLFSHLLLQKKGIWSFASSTIRKICCSIWIIINLVKTTCQNKTFEPEYFLFFPFSDQVTERWCFWILPWRTRRRQFGNLHSKLIQTHYKLNVNVFSSIFNQKAKKHCMDWLILFCKAWNKLHFL